MRKLWIYIGSVRSSLDQLVANLPQWMSASIKYEDYTGIVPLGVIWKLLGVPDAWRMEFSLLQVRFESGYICVAARFDGDDELIDRLMSCFYMF